MLHNSNNRFLRKLTRNSLKANRRRNIPFVLTITIAAALMSAVALLMLGIQTMNLRSIEGSYQGYAVSLSEKQQAALYDSPLLELVGANTSLGTVQNSQYSLNTSVPDAALLTLAKVKIRGTLPEAANEIVADSNFTAKYFGGAGIGDSIRLELEHGTEDFVITGLYEPVVDHAAQLTDVEVEKTTFVLYLSPAYLKQLDPDHAGPPVYYFRFAGSDQWEEHTLLDNMEALRVQAGLEKNQLFTSDRYVTMTKPMSIGNIAMLAGLGIVIAFACALVIYSVFYISVSASVRDYGRLRTLGATKKQVRGLVRREGVALALTGIAAGLLLGCAVAGIALPKGFSVGNTLLVCAVVAAVTFLTVMIATRKPAQLAAAVSPVEATRYRPMDAPEGKKTKKRPQRPLTPVRLALTQMKRSRRKTMLTLVSLSLSGLLFACAATYFSSQSVEKMTRGNTYLHGEFYIELQAADRDTDDGFNLGRMQENNPMPALMEQLRQVDGVQEVKHSSEVNANAYPPGQGAEKMEVSGYGPQDEDFINGLLNEGQLRYADALSGDLVILTITDTMDEIYGWKAKVGDRLTVEFWTAEGPVEHTFTIAGLSEARILPGTLLLPGEVLSRITGLDNTGRVTVKTDPAKTALAGAEIRELAGGDSRYFLEILSDMLASRSDIIGFFSTLIYSLVLVLLLFAAISLCNTILSGVLARCQELSMMQAVGMSGRQLSKMLYAEGSLYFAVTAAVTLTLGTLAGGLLIQALEGLSAMHYLDYQFPGLLLAAFLLFLFVIQFAITLFSKRIYKKQPLVLRMKEMEQ